MCHGDDARPPLPPVGGAAPSTWDLQLTAADGTRVLAHAARTERPAGRGVVILPDVRGLHEFYRDLADRFAEAGVDAVAIDYFGRTAAGEDRGHGFQYQPHMQQLRREHVWADAAAGVAHLRSPEGGAVRDVFSVGFCFGGSSSWSLAAAGIGVRAAIGFYGNPGRVEDVVDRLQVPILMLIAGADHVPVGDSIAFANRVRATGVPVETHVYDNAPHSFFDRTYDQWRDYCDDAWRRLLDFMERHSST
jgi:carboxymethylenebutenolidase